MGQDHGRDRQGREPGVLRRRPGHRQHHRRPHGKAGRPEQQASRGTQRVVAPGAAELQRGDAAHAQRHQNGPADLRHGVPRHEPERHDGRRCGHQRVGCPAPGPGGQRQGGGTENTNGLLRQYMPKGTDLSVHTAEDLARIARSLNNRPRKTLGFMKRSERLAELLAHTP
jgi:hypothetical protein